jgi:hypothetical protein
MTYLQPLPEAIPESSRDSLLEGTGFELPVRGRGQSGCRPFFLPPKAREGSVRPLSFRTARLTNDLTSGRRRGAVGATRLRRAILRRGAIDIILRRTVRSAMGYSRWRILSDPARSFLQRLGAPGTTRTVEGLHYGIVSSPAKRTTTVAHQLIRPMPVDIS